MLGTSFRSPTSSPSLASSKHSSIAAEIESEIEDLPPNTYRIAPPPEQEYPNPKAAEKAIHAWTKNLCYEMSRTKSDKNKNGIIYKQYYLCAKHGKPSNTRKLTKETRVRHGTKTRRTGCTMGIVVKAVDPKAPEGSWKIQHQAKSFIHNHPSALHASALSSHRRRAYTNEVKSIIKKQKTARIPANQTLAFLQDDTEECLISKRDINNIQVQSKQQELSSSTRIEALYAKMDSFGYYHDAKIDEEDHLEALFYSHPQSIKDFADNFDILMLDNTFKTNKYNIPVCNIIGVMGMNTTIQFGLAFMPTQDEAAFFWVLQQIQTVLARYGIETPRVIVTDREQACLNALKNVFPNVPGLICKWHMNKDVLSHCRRKHPQVYNTEKKEYKDSNITKDIYALYYKAVESTTEEQFQNACDEIRILDASMASYLDRTWWPYKERCVRIWTD